jgi:hypothetical protein
VFPACERFKFGNDPRFVTQGDGSPDAAQGG